MAYVDSTLSCPMATAGFGKRLTNGQRIARRGDFSHLPEREAYLAAFIDQLPEGAQMDIKTLAQAQPRFGQAAVASALRNLTLAGHLRRVQICVGEGGNRWAYRTWFSAVPHDDEWWTEFLRTEDAATPPAFPEETPVPAAEGDDGAVADEGVVGDEGVEGDDAAPFGAEAVDAAYAALADLARRDHRLILSARDCEALAGEAARWFERGVTAEQFAQAMAAGLPAVVHRPAGLVRSRLIDKLPPVRLRPRKGPDLLQPIRECDDCRAPGRPGAFVNGLCRDCRQA